MDLSHLSAGKMIGPLPAGAWVAVVGGGFAFMAYSKRKGTTVDTTASADTTATPADASGGSGVGGSGMWTDLTTPTTGTSLPPITTNDQWETAAINWLIAQGYDAGVSDSAIRKYIAGAQQSIQEYTLTKLALIKFGSLPEPLPPSSYPNPTVPTPIVPPNTGTFKVVPPTLTPTTPAGWAKAAPSRPAPKHYTTKAGDTLAGIAKGYRTSWQYIYNENRAIIGNNPNVLRPGLVLTIG